MAEKGKFTRECVACKNLFECSGKPDNVAYCVNFAWREGRKREENSNSPSLADNNKQ